MTNINNFEKYGDYYDLFNSDKDYQLEAKNVNKMISQHSKSVKTILEFGSGTGKHAVILADYFNYKIQGVRRSREIAGKLGEDYRPGGSGDCGKSLEN